MSLSASRLEQGSDLKGGHLSSEYELTDEDFRELVRLAYKTVGLHITEARRGLVYTRLARRIRTLNLASFAEYREHLKHDAGELDKLVDSLTTNHTDFFREPHHFEHLKETVLDPWFKSARSGSGARLRIWSAGCSSGQEPYSIALTLAGLLAGAPKSVSFDARILATDIDTQVLRTAEAGSYDAESAATIPEAFKSCLERGPDSAVTMGRAAKAHLTFKRLNLLEDWPFAGPFDAIFCRNVMIYFDVPTKRSLAEKFISRLAPGGILYIGHSEHLDTADLPLRPEGRTTYRKLT